MDLIAVFLHMVKQEQVSLILWLDTKLIVE